tara:strand:- start:421 stop:591 length:171 start_codon:yes stop_codon:yes gene_type:complete
MTEKWHGGKGSTPRPISNKKQFDMNWDKIFGKLDYEKSISESEGQTPPTVDKRPVD